MKTLRKPCKVGIYDWAEYTARIYPDRIVLTTPYVRWVGNTGSYAESKERLMDPELLARVSALLADDAIERAWGTIGRAAGDEWLMLADYAA